MIKVTGAAARYQAYMLGWHRGASGQAGSRVEYKDAAQQAEYRTGHQDGQKARAEAAARRAERLGLK